MQACRLVLDVDDPIVVARDDRHRDLQLRVMASGREGVRDQGGLARIVEGRSAISTGKSANLAGIEAGRKSFRMRSGQIARPSMGGTV